MIVPRSSLLFWVGMLIPVAAFAAAAPAFVYLSLVFFVVLCIIAVLDGAAGRNKTGALSVHLPAVVRLSKDQQGSIPLTIRNPAGRKQAFRVGLPLPNWIESEKEELDLILPEGSEFSRAEWQCKGIKRGKHLLGNYYAEIVSPLGFWNVRFKRPIDCEIRVYPNLKEDRKKAASFLNKGNFGVHTSRLVGQGREFEKLREYIHGDSFDQIHWKATAKRGKPVTKVFQIERTQEVYALIDCSRLTARITSGENRESVLEYSVRSALILGLAAQQQGDLYGILTFSNKVHSFLRASSGKMHYSACRDELYQLQPELVTPDFEDLFSFVRLRLNRRALLVILTDLNDPMLAENFFRSCRLVSKQHLVLVNMIRPGHAADLFSAPNVSRLDDLYTRLAGHVVMQNLRQLQNVLHRQGVSFALLDRSNLSAEVVRKYMSIKQRQLL
jgi:uncharacterized protein (DUF58 family)